MSKIIGNPVGTTLPKSDWKQTDPSKGDYIKNKPEVTNPSVGQFLSIKEIDEDGHITKLEATEVSVDNTLASEVTTLKGLVGDTSVAKQIEDAIDNYYTKVQIDNYEFITVEDIDTICGNTSE